MTRCGLLACAAISPIGKDDVLEAKIVSGRKLLAEGEKVQGACPGAVQQHDDHARCFRVATLDRDSHGRHGYRATSGIPSCQVTKVECEPGQFRCAEG